MLGMKTIILQSLWGYEHITEYTQESDMYFIFWHLYLSSHTGIDQEYFFWNQQS